MGIFFHYYPKSKSFPGKRKIKIWLRKIIRDNQKKIGDLNIIFINDQKILEINNNYLNHSYYTDIITFNYNTGEKLSGDIYISIERVEENSKKYNCTLQDELLRVIAHGILHLVGYNDKTKMQKARMKVLEDEAVDFFISSDPE